MRILGIETSCDETGVAIYDEEKGLIQKTNVIHNLNLSRHIINLETILNMFQSPQLTEDNKKLENSSFNNRSLRLLN